MALKWELVEGEVYMRERKGKKEFRDRIYRRRKNVPDLDSSRVT